ncbi:MAG: hydroxypyruvate isomerase family protein [Bacteroidota bacterium]
MKRKEALKLMTGGSLGLGIFSMAEGKDKTPNEVKLKGNINHSVCKWCYGDIPLREFAIACKDMGMAAIDLLGADDWKTVQDVGITCSLGTPKDAGIPKGLNDPNNHDRLTKNYIEVIEKAADAGIEKIIVFSGNRNGISDELGLENCAVGIQKALKVAEKKNITLVMELLNSKVNHPDYQCDHTEWGVRLAKKVGSPNFKLLYDIYHMQIMEGDVIRTIQDNHEYIAHYHTGGVPGRNEIDESQELYYPVIMKAILDTGYKGYVAQEFIPKKDDKLASLKAGVMICDV